MATGRARRTIGAAGSRRSVARDACSCAACHVGYACRRRSFGDGDRVSVKMPSSERVEGTVVELWPSIISLEARISFADAQARCLAARTPQVRDGASRGVAVVAAHLAPLFFFVSSWEAAGAAATLS